MVLCKHITEEPDLDTRDQAGFLEEVTPGVRSKGSEGEHCRQSEQHVQTSCGGRWQCVSPGTT